MGNDHRGAGPVPLDGNAAGGLLSELFALDVTAAEVVCGGCGATLELGAARVYGGSMGVIFRCMHCGTAVVRLVRTPSGLWIDMQGTRRMFVRSPLE
jgi:Family of unknown function (DUF6510)